MAEVSYDTTDLGNERFVSKYALLAAGIALFGSISAGQSKQSADNIRLIDSIQGPNLYQAYCDPT